MEERTMVKKHTRTHSQDRRKSAFPTILAMRMSMFFNGGTTFGLLPQIRLYRILKILMYFQCISAEFCNRRTNSDILDINA
jgi:hypothetical protein